MAGEALDSGWVRVAVEGAVWLVTLGGFFAHVRGKLSQHDAQLVEQKAMITDLQSKHASGVRPQDIAHLRELMTAKEQRDNERHQALLDALKEVKEARK